MQSISEAEKLTAKIELWKEINSYANRIEEQYPLFFSLFVAIASVSIALYSDKIFLPTEIKNTIIFLILLPIIIAAVMAYLSYNFRWVAIARMYLTTLEKEINESLGKNVFVWNTDIVEEYMSKRNFANTKLLPLVNSLFFLFIEGGLNYVMFSTGLHILIKIVYLIGTITLFILSICPFLGNEKIRKDNYVFPENLQH